MTHGMTPPYPGLRAFTREESHLFFGREGCVDSMIARLDATRFLAVLGTSGSGKSSLVRTGLLDALELGFYSAAGARWAIADMHPGGQPTRELALALLKGRGQEHAPVDVEVLRALLARGPLSLVEWCRAGGIAPNVNLLVLVDQFEELFRYGDYSAREEAEAFVALLLESSRAAGASIYVVLTMRSEYLGACSLVEGLAEQVNAGFYLTPRMSREECRLAIEGPAAVAGLSLEPALVNELLNDMNLFAPWHDQGSMQHTPLLSRRADQLPLMQHVLNRVWLRAVERRSDTPSVLTLDDYVAAGGLSGALDIHGAQVLALLPIDDQVDAERIFRALVSGTEPGVAVRRPCRFSELAALAWGGRSAARRVIHAFRSAGCDFLTPSASVAIEDDTLIDIGHESLIRQWSMLAIWLSNEARAVENWRRMLIGVDRQRTGEGGLLTGLELQALSTWWQTERPTPLWAVRYGGRYDEAAAFLLESQQAGHFASRAAASRARRQRRRLMVLVSVLSIMGVVVAVVGAKARMTAEQVQSTVYELRSELSRGRLALQAACDALFDRPEALTRSARQGCASVPRPASAPSASPLVRLPD